MHRIPPLPKNEVENLRRVCGSLGLPATALEHLVSVAQGIKLKEAGAEWKLAPRRRKELGKVADLAKRLNDALQALAHEDQSAIHQGFKGVQIQLELDPPDPIRSAFFDPVGDIDMRDVACENVLLLGDALLTLEGVARNASAVVNGQETGRSPRNTDLAMYVAEVGWCAYRNRLAIGRGGPFHVLCEAVFAAAGIDTDPDAAIRKFVGDFLPIYLEMWTGRGDDQGTG